MRVSSEGLQDDRAISEIEIASLMSAMTCFAEYLPGAFCYLSTKIILPSVCGEIGVWR